MQIEKVCHPLFLFVLVTSITSRFGLSCLVLYSPGECNPGEIYLTILLYRYSFMGTRRGILFATKLRLIELDSLHFERKRLLPRFAVLLALSDHIRSLIDPVSCTLLVSSRVLSTLILFSLFKNIENGPLSDSPNGSFSFCDGSLLFPQLLRSL
jgi:hypothetical protein